MADFDNCYQIEDLRRILNERVRNYEEQFGNSDKIIETFYNTSEDNYMELINECRLYVKAKQLITLTHDTIHVIPFGKIIGYDLIDVNANCSVPIQSATTTITKTDTGDLLKRAVIGGVIAGGVGAAIGATTANRTSTSEITEVDEYTNLIRSQLGSSSYYNLTIKIDDIVSPTITIPFDQYRSNAEEIAASLNAIVRRNADNNTIEDFIVVSESTELASTAKAIGIEPIDLNEKWAIEKQKRIAEEKEEQRQNTVVQVIVGLVLGVVFWGLLNTCS